MVREPTARSGGDFDAPRELTTDILFRIIWPSEGGVGLGNAHEVPGGLAMRSKKMNGLGAESGMRRLAAFCYRRRGTVTLVWVAALIVIGALSATFGGASKTNFSIPGAESQ